MGEVQTFRTLLLLIIIFSISACGAGDSREHSKSSNTVVHEFESYKTAIKLIENKGVQFKYALGDKTEFGDDFLIPIECMVINESGKELNYLNQSCNGLDYYLVISPDTYEVRPLINCNATWTRISKLAAKDTLKFETHILQYKDSKPIENIGVDFRVLNAFIPFNILRENPELVEKVSRLETQTDPVIWGSED